MDEKLLALPWQIQVALGSGYAAYLLAYAGIREHHKGVDVAFRSIAFGLIATVTLMLCSSMHPALAICLAFGWTLFAGVGWRKYGMALTKKVLRSEDVSWADDTPTAWATISVCNSKYPVSQICVLLDDGTWLRCIDTRPFAEQPFGPLTLGLNGDVALYVTSEETANGADVSVGNVLEDYWGARITYVPASRIKRITIRHYTG